jgi:phosphopantetheinyl transferase (holo-ACP synthase)
LLLSDQRALFHTDLIVIDTFTQLLGAWGLDYLKEGDVVFPLSMEELEIHGHRVPPGTVVECRITIKELDRHKVLVHAEIVRPDGTVWMRISDWQDWRFHWPGRYRDVFRQPRDYFAGEELALDDPAGTVVSHAKAVWLEPPADMGRPVWRDVLEQTQLGPRERAEFLATSAAEGRRTHRLWGRIAAKEAARRVWQEIGLPASYPADLAISDEALGPPRLSWLGQPGAVLVPSISIANCEGVAVALAALEPAARPGIALTLIANHEEGLLVPAFTPQERSLLQECADSSRMEWAARFWCAKQAALKAVGNESVTAGAAGVQRFDPETGVICVHIASADGAAPDDQRVRCLRVVSARRAGHVWAWTLGEGAQP